MKSIERRTYNLIEVARLLGIGRNQAYAAANCGEIPIIRIGGRMLVSKAVLDRMLDVDKPNE